VNNGPVIDAHVALGQEHYLTLEAPELMGRMDQSGVGLSIARPLGAEIAVYNRRGNDRVLSAGTRIKALATASPWLGREGIEELTRCHAAGAVGLYLHPTRQGFMPTDPIAHPLIEFARDIRWPVVIHTGTYINSDVLAVGELAREFRDVTFVCDNAGFTDMWFELPGFLTEHPNVLLCSSLIWARAILQTVQNHGAQRVLFGSGEPRDSLEAALKRIDRIDLKDADRDVILWQNAKRVFSLDADY
jgi:predicted TIM-barrel fold metal-dependent hydrolase